MTVDQQSQGAAADAVGAATTETAPPVTPGSADAVPVTTRAQADNLIKNHVIVAMSFALVPMPLFDLALLAGNQVAMVNALSELYGVPFEQNKARSIVIALVSSALPVLGVAALSSGIKLIPGIGSLFGSGTIAITGGALTYAVGQVFAAHFAAGGSLLDLDPAKMRDLFNEEVKKGKAAVAGFRAKTTTGPEA
jgi:uncharacterized protein (DUF697 family)